MKDKHVIDILELAPLASLSKGDLAAIEAHSTDCQDCRQAFEAAYLAAALLQQHAAEAFAPQRFFETKVLATLRERQAVNNIWSMGRLWRSAGALVSSMAGTVALLAALSFVVPSGESTGNASVVSASNNYSAETVIFDDSGLPEDQISDGQVMTTLYDVDEEVAK